MIKRNIESASLTTERLHLRQWKESDLPAFSNMNADPDVMKYYLSKLNSSESDTLAEKIFKLIDVKGWGFWAVELKVNSKFLGFVGLNEPDYTLPFSPCIEIGWRLGKQYWGKGYASEAAKQCLNVAFTQLDLDEVVSFTSLSNTRSQSVMKKIGMTNTANNFHHPLVPRGHPLSEHVLFKIAKVDWQNRNQKCNWS